MSIAVADNFSYQGSKPLDARFQFSTVANMKAAAETALYNGCFAYVTATKKYYSYDSSNSVDSTTGRWREYESGGVSDYPELTNKPQINGNELDGNKTGANLGLQNQTLSSPITIGGVSKTNVEDSLTALNVQTKPTKFTGAGSSSGTISKSDIVSAGCTKTFYWVWPAGSDYGTNPGFPLPFNWTYSLTDITYLVTITKDSDDTYIEYVAYSYFTYNSKTYSKIYTRVAKKSGSTWSFPAWTEVDNLPVATASVLGGVKIGENMTIEDGVINPSYLVVANKFNKADLYSTTEKVVGCWTDGRPLYQKTFTSTMPSNDGSFKTISIGANVDKAFVKEFVINNATYKWSKNGTALFTDSKDFSSQCYINTNGESQSPNVIKFCNLKDTWVGLDVYITVQYTKTTDSANSFKYADENDYSTSEKIVGTWIDGSLIYQKTISFGALPNNTLKEVAHGISNLKMYVKAFGMATNGTYTMMFNNSQPSGLTDASAIASAVNLGFQLYFDKTKIYVKTGSDRSTYSAYITVQYTKTS